MEYADHVSNGESQSNVTAGDWSFRVVQVVAVLVIAAAFAYVIAKSDNPWWALALAGGLAAGDQGTSLVHDFGTAFRNRHLTAQEASRDRWWGRLVGVVFALGLYLCLS